MLQMYIEKLYCAKYNWIVDIKMKICIPTSR